MRRRQALHCVLALALPLAGCAGSPQEPATTGVTGTDRNSTAATPLQVGETATVGESGELTVTSLSVQRAVTSTYLGLAVYEPDDGQVIVVETAEVVSVSEPVPFVPRLDGERVDSPTDIDISGYQPAAAVVVPVREAERAAVVLNGGSEPAWALPDEQVERLGAAPEFTLESARFDHETSELTLTVENSGDRDGTFRGGVDFGNDYTTPIEFPVAVGETHTEAVELSPPWDPSRDREFDVTAGTRVIQFQQ